MSRTLNNIMLDSGDRKTLDRILSEVTYWFNATYSVRFCGDSGWDWDPVDRFDPTSEQALEAGVAELNKLIGSDDKLMFYVSDAWKESYEKFLMLGKLNVVDEVARHSADVDATHKFLFSHSPTPENRGLDPAHISPKALQMLFSDTDGVAEVQARTGLSADDAARTLWFERVAGIISRISAEIIHRHVSGGVTHT